MTMPFQFISTLTLAHNAVFHDFSTENRNFGSLLKNSLLGKSLQINRLKESPFIFLSIFNIGELNMTFFNSFRPLLWPTMPFFVPFRPKIEILAVYIEIFTNKPSRRVQSIISSYFRQRRVEYDFFQFISTLNLAHNAFFCHFSTENSNFGSVYNNLYKLIVK